MRRKNANDNIICLKHRSGSQGHRDTLSAVLSDGLLEQLALSGDTAARSRPRNNRAMRLHFAYH